MIGKIRRFRDDRSLLLALAGGIAALVIARGGAAILLGLAPQNLVQLSGIAIDRSMLFYTAGLSLLTGVVVGLVRHLRKCGTGKPCYGHQSRRTNAYSHKCRPQKPGEQA